MKLPACNYCNKDIKKNNDLIKMVNLTNSKIEPYCRKCVKNGRL